MMKLKELSKIGTERLAKELWNLIIPSENFNLRGKVKPTKRSGYYLSPRSKEESLGETQLLDCSMLPKGQQKTEELGQEVFLERTRPFLLGIKANPT